jgi:glycine/D-amino acid oxidase-like deaminating enzyme
MNVDLVVVGSGAVAQAVAYGMRAAGWSVAAVDSRPFAGFKTRHTGRRMLGARPAVVVEANAADQVLHVLLAETGVGATGAGGGTVEALADAAQQRVPIKARRLWMRLDHLLNCHFLSLPVRASSDPAVRVSATRVANRSISSGS